ncbi:MAG: hypothetical protein V4720_01985 [Pseudomonadota bacterium]
MQGQRGSQNGRTEAMRAARVSFARDLFARDGFAATATPDIVDAALHLLIKGLAR